MDNEPENAGPGSQLPVDPAGVYSANLNSGNAAPVQLVVARQNHESND